MLQLQAADLRKGLREYHHHRQGYLFWQRTELVALEKAAAAGCDCPLRGAEQGYPTGRAGVCHAGGCPAPVFSAADFL